MLDVTMGCDIRYVIRAVRATGSSFPIPTIPTMASKGRMSLENVPVVVKN